MVTLSGNVTVALLGKMLYNQGTLRDSRKESSMKTKIAAVVVGCMLTAPAFAWGDREQGILSGIAGYWLYNRLTTPQVIVTPQGGQMPVPAPTYPSYGGAMPPPPIIYQPNCRQVLTIQMDRFGNQYNVPMTVCQ